MWTEEQRRIYRREGDGYPSDLRDTEWAQLKPLIPSVRPGGRPRKTDMRAAMNAILYLLRTGCPWRYLPRDGFRHTRRSTTSFASSSAKGSGRRSGPSCTWPCASGWGAAPADRVSASSATPCPTPVEPSASWDWMALSIVSASRPASLAARPTGSRRRRALSVGHMPTSVSRLPALIATMTETIPIVQPLRSR